MRYNPSSKVPQPEPGTYRFTVLDAEEKTARSGYDYISMTLAVQISPVGEPNKLQFVNLLSTPSMLWRTEQFCKAIGFDFENGELSPQDCIGSQGIAKFDWGKPNNSGNVFLEPKQYLHDDEAAIADKAISNKESAMRMDGPPVDDDNGPPPSDDQVPADVDDDSAPF